MGDSFQYGDIIFLGLIAVFVALRLRSMLGKDGGLDPRDMWHQASRDVNPERSVFTPDRTAKKPEVEDIVPQALESNAVVTAGLKAIRAADTNFSTTDFVAGAKLAFEWIVEAFAKADKDRLRALLSDERYRHFEGEIDARGKDGMKHETTLVSILSADITEAQLAGVKAQITVQYTSEQVSVTRDKDNAIVSGDLSALEKVIDVWTFERDVSSRDPNWKIIAT
jgi:predicted lipid-binding transport protein (Tim44 family)